MFCQTVSVITALIVICQGVSAAADAGPLVLAEGSGATAPKQPQAFVSDDGRVDVVYAAGDEVFVSTSEDSGASFKPAAGHIQCANLSAGMRRGPRIVRLKQRLVVTAIGGIQGKGRDGDVMAWHSDDQGTSWSTPVRVNDSADSAREGLHAMTVSPDGTIYCVWLDLREKRTEVYLSKSSDGGTTWSENVIVYRSPGGNVCECCHPSVVATNNMVAVMFRNSLDGNRDMFTAVSEDGGTTFHPASKLGTGAWRLDACPMDGGMLAVNSKGSLLTVWRRDKQVFSATGESPQETLLGNGEQPWIAATAANPVLVWTSGREGKLLMQKGLTGKPVEIAAAASHAMVSSAPGGHGPVIVCWESKKDGVVSVLARSSPVD